MSLNPWDSRQSEKLKYQSPLTPFKVLRIMEALLLLREMFFCQGYFLRLQTITDIATVLTLPNQETFSADNTTDYTFQKKK